MKSIRYILGVVSAVAVVAMLSGKAMALKEEIEVTPKNVEANGFTISAEARENDMLRVRIVRDLAKARSFPAESPNELYRNAELRVYGEMGMLVRCGLEPAADEKTVTYTFEFNKDQLGKSHVTVYEYDGYKDRTRQELPIGGGTLFRFHFEDFADLLMSDKPPEKEDKPSVR